MDLATTIEYISSAQTIYSIWHKNGAIRRVNIAAIPSRTIAGLARLAFTLYSFCETSSLLRLSALCIRPPEA